MRASSTSGSPGFAEVWLVVEAALHVFEADSGGDCHAIPLIQAEVCNLVAHEFEEVEGEGFVLGFVSCRASTSTSCSSSQSSTRFRGRGLS